MASVANLIAGTPTVYIAATGEALPEVNDLTPPAVTISTPGGNWTAIGFDKDSFSIEYTPTHELSRVNAHKGPVKSFLVDEDIKVKFSLAEHDFQAYSEAINASTLATVSAAADQVAQDTLTVGDTAVSEKTLLVVGTSPEAGSRVIHFWKAIQTGAVTFEMNKGEYSATEVEWTVIADTTQTAGARMFKWYDITAVASS